MINLKIEIKLRIKNIIDPNPLLDRQMLQLTRKVADYYCTSWGEVIEAAHPANVRNRKRPIVLEPDSVTS